MVFRRNRKTDKTGNKLKPRKGKEKEMGFHNKYGAKEKQGTSGAANRRDSFIQKKTSRTTEKKVGLREKSQKVMAGNGAKELTSGPTKGQKRVRLETCQSTICGGTAFKIAISPVTQRRPENRRNLPEHPEVWGAIPR